MSCALVWCSVFFFKQKTAYEMRMSDWSSDVCSSDLLQDALHDHQPQPPAVRTMLAQGRCAGEQPCAHLGRDAQASIADPHFDSLARAAQPYLDTGARRAVANGVIQQEIGRASCRERVCQDV